MNSEQSFIQPTNVDNEKQQLEKEKLRLEICHLRRPFYRNPQYLPALAAIIVAITTLMITLMSGILDKRLINLENRKLVLQLDIDRFEKQRDSVKLETLRYQRQADSLQKANKIIVRLLRLSDEERRKLSNKYQREKKGIATELGEVERLLKANNLHDAYKILTDIVRKLNGITGRIFSDEFSDDFG